MKAGGILVAIVSLLTLVDGASAAACRAVHGRLSLSNGAPTARIWVVGTHRVLGVLQPNDSFTDLPAGVRQLWAGKTNEEIWASEIVGDFEVCAATRSMVGRMQLVTVKAAKHLILKPRT
jgi:hypothetical protein